MNKEKICKIIRWAALIPFILLFLYAILMSFIGSSFMGEPISGFEAFMLVLILWFSEFWWVFLISFVLIVGTSLLLHSIDSPKILKIIRLIAYIPFVLLLWVILRNIIWGEGLIAGVCEAIEVVSDPEGRFVFLGAGITVIVTSLFIAKSWKKEKKNES